MKLAQNKPGSNTMRRGEIGMELGQAQGSIDKVNSAWETSDIRKFEEAARQIETVLAAARKQFKDDLYNEAAK